MRILKHSSRQTRGVALLLVTVLTFLGLGLVVLFLQRSHLNLVFSKISRDSKEADLRLDSALSAVEAKFERAMAEISLSNKLQYSSGSATLASQGERFDVINNLYATDTDGSGSSLDEAQDFLEHMIVSQAYSAAGVLDSSHEFHSFASAFPTTWADPDPSDSEYYEVKYSFSPLRVESQIAIEPKQIIFEYEYQIEVRSYGSETFLAKTAESAGILEIRVEGSPFSKWAFFTHILKNQGGATLYMAGGNTSSQIQEIYGGPVHVNLTPNFLGHPTFNGLFTSATTESGWNYKSITNYTSCASWCPTWNGGKMGGVPTVTMPTAIFNTHRLAAGDTSTTASTNNNAPTVTEMKSFLANHAEGVVDPAATSIANGIYIPVNSAAAKVPTGGIFVQGDATAISMNVLQNEADFDPNVWTNIPSVHQGCKFQTIKITAGATIRDVYIGSGSSCDITYVFNGADYTQTPTTLYGRPNGNIHSTGAINSLGGASRTRPAVATDFGITVSAVKDVYIKNDLQYEDAEYVTLSSTGVMGTTAVANAYGTIGSSGYTPASAGITPIINEDSQTVLGIISTKRNVLIYTSNPYSSATSAPSEINLHAAIFAGNSAAYSSSTGEGCGSGANAGCGFGVLNYSTAPNLGSIKMFGSISEYRDQTTGTVSGSTVKGYGSVYMYDSRLQNSISPPAFPISNSPGAFAQVRPYKLFRVAGR